MRDPARPFYCHVAFSAPHYPLNESADWVKPYEGLFDDPSRRRFAGAMTHMDDSVGRIIEAIDEAGIADQTLVIFISDNGGQESWDASVQEYNGRYAPHTRLGDNSPLRGWKVDLYEGGIRVPALAWWPDRLAPGKTEATLSVYDLLPTLARLAGASLPAGLELVGRDMWPALAGEDFPSSRTFYIRTGEAMTIRSGPWKLIHKGSSLKEGPDELYNVARDPCEKNDLSRERPDLVKSLRARLADEVRRDGY
jgi:arylsulfatase A-like enzyme